MREIVFDTETTGLKPEEGERVIEIGGIELVNRFPTGKTFHVYINPDGREVHPDALKVHGITNEFLADKPKFIDIAEEFISFFSDADLIAHNARFDVNFLNHELRRLDAAAIDEDRVIDTLIMARRKHPMGPNSLDALCSRYNIDNSSRTKHGALLDSELLADVYIELLGGRQASFSLETDSGSSRQDQSGTELVMSARKKRPNPLPPRISVEDEASHAAFVEQLGDEAIWKRYGD